MDPIAHVGHLRRDELLAEAAAQRLGRACRRQTRRPGLALRLYARLWWASRPRVGTWPRSAVGYQAPL